MRELLAACRRRFYRITVLAVISGSLALAVPALASAKFRLSVAPSKVHQGGTLRVRVSSPQRCIYGIFKRHGTREVSKGELRRRVAHVRISSKRFSRGSYVLLVECGRMIERSRFVVVKAGSGHPSPAPAPTPIAGGPTGGGTPAPGSPPLPPPPPPPPPPPVTAHAIDKLKVGTAKKRWENPNYTDEPGNQSCEFGTISIQPPVVTDFAANGQYLWTYDLLLGTPTGTDNWTNQGYDWWYAGSLGGPPDVWTNYYSGTQNTGFQPLDDWTINSGWTVTIVQYVYADGYWEWNAYDSAGNDTLQVCEF